ncbi:hypothetical protein XENOCAPTIV_019828 [Xenoophorus captivus]|uniref:Uncharacterized protein n=1 Tax=Xenoophorus captivus TaxID=1517983 RepID=A0ABV0S9V4_9TELE
MAGAAFGDTSDASLHAFSQMSREVGHLLVTSVFTQNQVWLAQAPLSDDCRQTMRSLLVVPNQLFGTTEAERALERQQQSSQASEVWHSCSGCMATPSQQQRKRGAQEPWCQFREVETLRPPKSLNRRRTRRAVGQRWVKVRVIPRCMALCYWRDVVYLQHRVPLGALKGLEPLIHQTLECPGSFYFEGLCLLATFYSMVQ